MVISDSVIPFAPRSGTMNWFVKVGAAKNGTIIASPTMTIWCNENTDGTPVDDVTVNPNTTTTVSAKPQYNAQLKAEGNKNYSVTLMMYQTVAGKGLKGQELPDGSPITFDLTTNFNQTLVDYKSNNTTDPGAEGTLASGDYGHILC